MDIIPTRHPQLTDSHLVSLLAIDYPMIYDAFVMASDAHYDQRRISGEPYMWHPLDVADTLMSHLVDDVPPPIKSHLCTVALLHDTVEDTSMTYTTIRDTLEVEVADDVFMLTNSVSKDKGDRAFRVQAAITKLKYSPTHIQVIKMSDMLCNVRTIRVTHPKFAKQYIGEKMMALRVISPDAILLAPTLYAELQATLGHPTDD